MRPNHRLLEVLGEDALAIAAYAQHLGSLDSLNLHGVHRLDMVDTIVPFELTQLKAV